MGISQKPLRFILEAAADYSLEVAKSFWLLLDTFYMQLQLDGASGGAQIIVDTEI